VECGICQSGKIGEDFCVLAAMPPVGGRLRLMALDGPS
jgi:hypothetical protein